MILLEDFLIFGVFGGAVMLSFSEMNFLLVGAVSIVLIIGSVNLLSGRVERSFAQLSGIIPLGLASVIGGEIGAAFLIIWFFFYLTVIILFDF